MLMSPSSDVLGLTIGVIVLVVIANGYSVVIHLDVHHVYYVHSIAVYFYLTIQ